MGKLSPRIPRLTTINTMVVHVRWGYGPIVPWIIPQVNNVYNLWPRAGCSFLAGKHHCIFLRQVRKMFQGRWLSSGLLLDLSWGVVEFRTTRIFVHWFVWDGSEIQQPDVKIYKVKGVWIHSILYPWTKNIHHTGCIKSRREYANICSTPTFTTNLLISIGACSEISFAPSANDPIFFLAELPHRLAVAGLPKSKNPPSESGYLYRHEIIQLLLDFDPFTSLCCFPFSNCHFNREAWNHKRAYDQIWWFLRMVPDVSSNDRVVPTHMLHMAPIRLGCIEDLYLEFLAQMYVMRSM